MRQGPRPGEWRLHPKVVKQIWRVFGQAQVDFFATHQTSHCPLWFSLTHPAPLVWYRRAEASSVRLSLDRSALRSSRESAPEWGPAVASSSVLAGPSMVIGPDLSPRRLSMGDSRQEGSALTGGGHDPSSPPGVIEAVDVAPEGAQLMASGLSTEVVETILQSRAPSATKLYALKCKLFTSWCGDRQLDPVKGQIGTVLEFLQACFSSGLTHSTLKVYVAAFSGLPRPSWWPVSGHRPSGYTFSPWCNQAQASGTISCPSLGPCCGARGSL